jgi:hypothetical protein
MYRVSHLVQNGTKHSVQIQGIDQHIIIYLFIAHNQIKQYYRPQIIAFKPDFIHRKQILHRFVDAHKLLHSSPHI